MLRLPPVPVNVPLVVRSLKFRVPDSNAISPTQVSPLFTSTVAPVTDTFPALSTFNTISLVNVLCASISKFPPFAFIVPRVALSS